MYVEIGEKDVLYVATQKRNIGLHMPLLVLSRLWESISMDFIHGLMANTKQNSYIFLVSNHFSEMAIPIPCKETIMG